MKGRGNVLASAVPEARLLPKSEEIDPALTTASFEKLAPLTIPLSPITGAPTARVTGSTWGLLLISVAVTWIVPL